MTIPTEVMMTMATIGLSEEQARAVADMLTKVETATAATMSAAHEESKAKARARVARWRERNVTKRYTTSRNGSRVVEDKPLPTEIEPQEENKKRAQDALRSEFEAVFWPEYPNKVGKPKALVAYCAARKRAELSTILDGLRQYVANKPADRAWLNPATFLNQDRFNDQPAVVVPMARAGPRRNGLMDLLNAHDVVPRNDDTNPSEVAVFDLPATAYR